MDIDAERRNRMEADRRFRTWEEVFRMALVGAAAGSRQTTLVMADAIQIADLAVKEIEARRPPESGR